MQMAGEAGIPATRQANVPNAVGPRQVIADIRLRPLLAAQPTWIAAVVSHPLAGPDSVRLRRGEADRVVTRRGSTATTALQMCAFSLESFGRIGTEANAMIAMLASARASRLIPAGADCHEQAATVRARLGQTWRQEISVIIQRGSALIVQAALEGRAGDACAESGHNVASLICGT